MNRSTDPPLTSQEWELVGSLDCTSPGLFLTLLLANPVATFWTASEMLAWLGEQDAADILLEIVESLFGRSFSFSLLITTLYIGLLFKKPESCFRTREVEGPRTPPVVKTGNCGHHKDILLNAKELFC